MKKTEINTQSQSQIFRGETKLVVSGRHEEGDRHVRDRNVGKIIFHMVFI